MDLQDHLELTEAIRQNPDDDERRLILSDCLEENGFSLAATSLRAAVALQQVPGVLCGFLNKRRWVPLEVKPLLNGVYAGPQRWLVSQFFGSIEWGTAQPGGNTWRVRQKGGVRDYLYAPNGLGWYEADKEDIARRVWEWVAPQEAYLSRFCRGIGLLWRRGRIEGVYIDREALGSLHYYLHVIAIHPVRYVCFDDAIVKPLEVRQGREGKYVGERLWASPLIPRLKDALLFGRIEDVFRERMKKEPTHVSVHAAYRWLSDMFIQLVREEFGPAAIAESVRAYGL